MTTKEAPNLTARTIMMGILRPTPRPPASHQLATSADELHMATPPSSFIQHIAMEEHDSCLESNTIAVKKIVNGIAGPL